MWSEFSEPARLSDKITERTEVIAFSVHWRTCPCTRCRRSLAVRQDARCVQHDRPVIKDDVLLFLDDLERRIPANLDIHLIQDNPAGTNHADPERLGAFTCSHADVCVVVNLSNLTTDDQDRIRSDDQERQMTVDP
jgi:hypothetical protein